ncbi:type II toxin-antitoxin system ParD family antitoxin [Clavibacter michiganensis]|nr:type II toxin-antitoxin system ParD family antitoxin [Clavibacter michiganensis]KAF0257241.1 Antitoxin ParD1 [Clavibacter michiganensis subsp. michiganensis]MBE3078778.1 hypothetical protein [Clavibacter michiganensis subsp. michiganensis]MBW8027357.1 hypothetical protein [Clavibacter michiganensis subsp. michiganensis]MDO4017047.1 type II toxin-antitoxin system ParD family antitoxin [Clavibacter michiganensis]MDO4037303.1 type II toxin-antitoxin system ParD family antitoxin [Clavibacter mi
MASGRYRSASEVVHAGFRRMEDQESQLAGEASGEAAPFDLDAFIADKRT